MGRETPGFYWRARLGIRLPPGGRDAVISWGRGGLARGLPRNGNSPQGQKPTINTLTLSITENRKRRGNHPNKPTSSKTLLLAASDPFAVGFLRPKRSTQSSLHQWKRYDQAQWAQWNIFSAWEVSRWRGKLDGTRFCWRGEVGLDLSSAFHPGARTAGDKRRPPRRNSRCKVPRSAARPI